MTRAGTFRHRSALRVQRERYAQPSIDGAAARLRGTTGQRPWLAADASEVCGERLRLLGRTASNSFFSQVVSALSIPEPGKEIEEAVQ